MVWCYDEVVRCTLPIHFRKHLPKPISPIHLLSYQNAIICPIIIFFLCAKTTSTASAATAKKKVQPFNINTTKWHNIQKEEHSPRIHKNNPKINCVYITQKLLSICLFVFRFFHFTVFFHLFFLVHQFFPLCIYFMYVCVFSSMVLLWFWFFSSSLF